MRLLFKAGAMLSVSPSPKRGNHPHVLILVCLALLVLGGVGYAWYGRASDSVSGPAAANQAGTGVSKVYSQLDTPNPANVEVESEKPNPPLGLPLEKLGVFCDNPRDPVKQVALTFDDGPSQMTPEYLNVLQSKGVHATFFLIGKNVQRLPGMADMIAADGDEIGNHTYSHLNLAKASVTEGVYDILRGQDCIEQATHQKPYLMRPPGGELDVPAIKAIQKLGYRIVFWNVDPQDWKKGATPEQIIGNIMTNLRPGDIILLHEGKPQTLTALPELIDDIRKQGYQIDTVSGLQGAPRRRGPAAGPSAATPATTLPEAHPPGGAA